MIDKPLTLQMIILGLKTNEKDKTREVTGKEVADSIGVFTSIIVPPYDLSQYANGNSEMSDELFFRVVQATRSEGRVMYIERNQRKNMGDFLRITTSKMRCLKCGTEFAIKGNVTPARNRKGAGGCKAYAKCPNPECNHEGCGDQEGNNNTPTFSIS